MSLVVNQVKLKTVLKLMLQPLGLTYKLEDDVVLITSPHGDQAQTITQTYYVGDLVMPPDHGPQNLLPHSDGSSASRVRRPTPTPAFGA